MASRGPVCTNKDPSGSAGSILEEFLTIPIRWARGAALEALGLEKKEAESQ